MRRSRSRSPRDRDRDRSDARGGVRGRGPVDAPGHDRDRDRPRGGPPRDLLPGDRRDYRGGGGGGPPPRSSRSRSRSGGRRRSRSRSRDRDARDRRDGGKGAAAPPAPAAAAAPAPPAAAGGTRRDDRARSRSRSPRRRSRSPEPLRSKEEEELLELTRDARTVFVQQLVVRASERDVREYFEQVGPVSDVRLIRDRASGRSKGFGYVEFEDLEAVPKALLLNGQIMCMKHRGCTCSGFPVSVKPSQAEKNYAAMAEAAGGSTSAATLEKRVYIGNLSPAISEGDLKALATIIGVPDKVFLIRDSKGVSRGYAYIQFAVSSHCVRVCVCVCVCMCACRLYVCLSTVFVRGGHADRHLLHTLAIVSIFMCCFQSVCVHACVHHPPVVTARAHNLASSLAGHHDGPARSEHPARPRRRRPSNQGRATEQHGRSRFAERR